jgi:hypothetical protein
VSDSRLLLLVCCFYQDHHDDEDDDDLTYVTLARTDMTSPAKTATPARSSSDSKPSRRQTVSGGACPTRGCCCWFAASGRASDLDGLADGTDPNYIEADNTELARRRAEASFQRIRKLS